MADTTMTTKTPNRDEAERDPQPRARPDRAARRRRRDPLRAAALRRPRRLAPDGARRARRPRARRDARAPPRQRHVRERAEDRAGADDDLVHGGHAAPRDGSRQPHARSPRHAGGRAPRAAAARLPVGARRRSSSASGSPTTRRWRSRRCTCASRSCRGSRPPTSSSSSFYDILQERFGIEIVGGLQTIEPTVTNEEESEALGVPLHSPAFLFERTTRSASGEIVEYVRSIYRGDRYKLVTELNRKRPRAAAASARRLRASRADFLVGQYHAAMPRARRLDAASPLRSRAARASARTGTRKVVLTTLELCANVPTQ